VKRRARIARRGSDIDAVNADKITRASKSNLALAFVALRGERRRDITTFYAFCRVIDDIADSAELDPATKARQLNEWRESLVRSTAGEPSLASELRAVMAKYHIGAAMLEEIIAGVEMDLTIRDYATFQDLRKYCYGVASAVGLVSIEIFGYRNPRCKEYAIELGLALQLTNIIRDVGKDLANDRVYIPQEDLMRFGYATEELRARSYNERFLELMQFEADRAKQFFARAEAVLPAEDRRSMLPARIMASVYRALLDRIERDRFQLFAKEYRLSKPAKAARVVAQLLN
jgi:phytoene synthase